MELTYPAIVRAQKAICVERGAAFLACLPESKLGFALATKGKVPFNGLRHPPKGETNGWYSGCGTDFRDDADFFCSPPRKPLVRGLSGIKSPAWTRAGLPILACCRPP